MPYTKAAYSQAVPHSARLSLIWDLVYTKNNQEYFY